MGAENVSIRDNDTLYGPPPSTLEMSDLGQIVVVRRVLGTWAGQGGSRAGSAKSTPV